MINKNPFIYVTDEFVTIYYFLANCLTRNSAKYEVSNLLRLISDMKVYNFSLSITNIINLNPPPPKIYFI
uniref:CPXV160 protein n=1 Tax=Ascaris lumbricoides TaxID=6252 RepID=A0A0M3HIZ6_ASCLU